MKGTKIIAAVIAGALTLGTITVPDIRIPQISIVADAADEIVYGDYKYTINTDSLDNKGMKYIFGINVKKLIEEGAYTEKSSGDCTVLDPRNETKCLDCQTIIVILDDESSSTTAILNDAESQGCTNGFIKFDNNIEIYKNVKNLS